LMKKSARLINCARGGIIDEAALVRALEAKKIAGVALDVFEVEPPDFKSKLFQFDNCVVTPHLGASTSEAQVNVAVEIAETVRDALLGKGIINAANFPSIDSDSYKIIEPYINLALKMGKFTGQLINGRLNSVKITYSGVVTDYKVAPLTLSLISGLLKPIVGDNVNFINALDVAKERAINVQEIKSSKGGEFVNFLRAEIVTDKETFSVSGTLSANMQPRIVKVNNVYVEAVPEGDLIYIKNNDKPGIVGTIGSVLAEDKVNIAGISLGRESKKNGTAICVVSTDSEVTQKTIDKLNKNRDIVFVKYLKV